MTPNSMFHKTNKDNEKRVSMKHISSPVALIWGKLHLHYCPVEELFLEQNKRSVGLKNRITILRHSFKKNKHKK